MGRYNLESLRAELRGRRVAAACVRGLQLNSVHGFLGIWLSVAWSCGTPVIGVRTAQPSVVSSCPLVFLLLLKAASDDNLRRPTCHDTGRARLVYYNCSDSARLFSQPAVQCSVNSISERLADN